MNARLINLSALFLVGTVARFADAQGLDLAPATATDPLRAPPPDSVTGKTGPATATDVEKKPEAAQWVALTSLEKLLWACKHRQITSGPVPLSRAVREPPRPLRGIVCVRPIR